MLWTPSLARIHPNSIAARHSETYAWTGDCRNKLAQDLNYFVEAASVLPGEWTRLTNIDSTTPSTDGLSELVTVRDSLSSTNPPRFFRLFVRASLAGKHRHDHAV